MKRLLLPLLAVLALLALAAIPVLAQDNNLIALNDATPAIDVVITLPPDSTGTVSMNLWMTSVTVKDAGQAVVFRAADPRLHAIELNFAPNSGSHTLTIERLPGTAEAFVTIVSLPEMTVHGGSMLVSGSTLRMNQGMAMTVGPNNPGGSATVSIPSDAVGLFTATFPGTSATTQILDSTGSVMVQTAGGHVDGMNLVLDGGDYQFTLVSSTLVNSAVVGLRAVPAQEGGFTVLQAPASPTVSAASCTATVVASSVNLRSGPGTGYSVLGYGYREQTFTVGGQNPSDNWIVVGTDSGSAWVARSNMQTQGQCDNLTVFNIPLRNAQPAQIVITTSSPPQTSASAGTTTVTTRNDDDDDDDDHNDDDDD